MNSFSLLCSVIFTIFIFSFKSTHALYFHIGETERKCFIEEIPDETTVLVNYKVELYDPRSGGFMPSSPGIGMHVEVKDPDGKVILSRSITRYGLIFWGGSARLSEILALQKKALRAMNGSNPREHCKPLFIDWQIQTVVYSYEGRISFTSHTPGEHGLCLYSNSTKWIGGTQLRVHLDIQVGEHAIDYATVAQKDKLTELQLRVRQLLDQVDQITKEQNYQRYREERFRMTSESTNQRVFWWSLSQLCILLVMGVWQMRHLKSFFEAKKLV